MKHLARALALIATTAATVLVLLIYSPKVAAPFDVPKLAALEVCAALGVVALLVSRATTGGPRFSRAWLVAAVLLVATTLASWLVARASPDGAPYANAALARWGSLFGVVSGASVLAGREEDRTRVILGIVFTAALVAIVGLLQHTGLLPHALWIPVRSTPGATFGNRNLAAEVMAMVLPLAVAALLIAREREERALLMVAVGLELVFLGVTRTRGAWVGALLGLATIAWLERRRLFASRRAVSFSLGIGLAAAVAAVVPGHQTGYDAGDTKRYESALTVLEGAVDPQSTALRTRLGFWRRTLRMIEDAPVLGVGPGSWPVAFPRYAEPDATRDEVLTMTLAPRQSHNDLLERAAETGLLGFAALVAFAVVSARCVTRRLESDPDASAHALSAGAAAALVSLLGLSLTSFPFEMPATILLAGLALGLVVAGPSGDTTPAPRLALPIAAFSLLLLGCVAARAVRSVRGSYWLEIAEHARRGDHGAAGAEAALVALGRAADAAGETFTGDLRTAQMFTRLRRGAEATVAAKRALAIEPYSVNAWGALASAHEVAGHLEDARDAATHALAILHDYPPALHVRSVAMLEATGVADDADLRALRLLAETSKDRDTREVAEALLRESGAQ